MTKKKILILPITLLAIYYSSYFITREAHFPNNDVLIIRLGMISNETNSVHLSIPLSLEAIDDYHKSIKRREWPLTINDPIHEFYLFRMRGVFENTIPTNFKFFLPAIVSEATVLFFYSNIIKRF